LLLHRSPRCGGLQTGTENLSGNYLFIFHMLDISIGVEMVNQSGQGRPLLRYKYT
jgi:hypothetical protein